MPSISISKLQHRHEGRTHTNSLNFEDRPITRTKPIFFSSFYFLFLNVKCKCHPWNHSLCVFCNKRFYRCVSRVLSNPRDWHVTSSGLRSASFYNSSRHKWHPVGKYYSPSPTQHFRPISARCRCICSSWCHLRLTNTRI